MVTAVASLGEAVGSEAGERLGPQQLIDHRRFGAGMDGTLLNAYSVPGLTRVGIDPTAKKFLEHYGEGIQVVDDFFSEAAFRGAADRRARQSQPAEPAA